MHLKITCRHFPLILLLPLLHSLYYFGLTWSLRSAFWAVQQFSHPSFETCPTFVARVLERQVFLVFRFVLAWLGPALPTLKAFESFCSDPPLVVSSDHTLALTSREMIEVFHFLDIPLLVLSLFLSIWVAGGSCHFQSIVQVAFLVYRLSCKFQIFPLLGNSVSKEVSSNWLQHCQIWPSNLSGFTLCNSISFVDLEVSFVFF